VQRLTDAWGRRGPLTALLWPVSQVYGALAALRRIAYRRGWSKTVRLPVPVVIVGNLIAGGAGKTPTVIATVQALRERGFFPGIVSRGYGREGSEAREVMPSSMADEVGDEPLLLRLRTGAPVFVGRDRPEAARQLLRRHPRVDVVVSDDGLQHLALARDASVVVFDERGAGNGWLLPAGPLREPLPAHAPGGWIVLYNAAAPTTHLPGLSCTRGLAGATPLAAWWRGEPPDRETLHALAGRRLLAAAGTARPQRFFDMLAQANLDFEALPLADHHRYEVLPWPPGTADVIVTEKDAVKLPPDHPGLAASGTRVWVAALDFRPEPAYGDRLAALIARAPTRTPSPCG
jgi:tetraacyldisaccharide 4'-kinase